MLVSCSKFVALTLSLASLTSAHAAAQQGSEPVLERRDTAAVPRPVLGSVPYGSIINNCVKPGTVALTFDDGPGPYTAKLLDYLAANGVKATFFLLGNAIEVNGTGLVQRMVQEGHQVGSHTYDHQSLESLSTAQRAAEMYRNEAIFTNLIGVFPTYMRPPYGFCYAASGCLRDMGALGYHVIDWSVDTKDYQNDSPTLIQVAKNNWDAAFYAGNVKTSAFIPLTHDVHKQTVDTLAPYMIAEIKAQGYSMVTVGECLGDPAQNWYRDPKTGSYVAAKAIQHPAANSTSTSVSVASVTSVNSALATSSFVAASTTSTVAASSAIGATASLLSMTSSSSSASAAATSSRSAASRLTFSTTLCGLLVTFYTFIHA